MRLVQYILIGEKLNHRLHELGYYNFFFPFFKMNLAIIQARMGSTRFPGKVLKKIKDKTLLQHLLERIEKSKKIDELIVATTTTKIDNQIENFCNEKKIKCFRGSENDVLDRFYKAVLFFNRTPETILRVTADCPLHHSEVIDFCVSEFYKQKTDYFSNSNQLPILEDGCDTEVFTFSALETAWKEAKKKSEREHVTPYIKNSEKFKCIYKKFHPDYNFKLSVDNENDFKTVSEIFNYFYPNEFFTINDIVMLLKRHPEILMHNKSSIINEGYKKSLEND